jgi:hypothetical protein
MKSIWKSAACIGRNTRKERAITIRVQSNSQRQTFTRSVLPFIISSNAPSQRSRAPKNTIQSSRSSSSLLIHKDPRKRVKASSKVSLPTRNPNQKRKGSREPRKACSLPSAKRNHSIQLSQPSLQFPPPEARAKTRRKSPPSQTANSAKRRR